MAVSIVSTRSTEDARKAVDLLGGMGRFVNKGDSVVVKPNICAGKPSSTGAVTDPEMVAEVCRMVAEAGGEPLVAESPIYPFRGPRVYERAGYADFEKRYGFPFLDIDTAPSREIAIPAGRRVKNSVIAEAVLNCERIINMPVMKTHLQTTVTMSLKNIKGAVPGKQKHIIHLQGLDQGIVDINTVVRSDLVIMDGITGMEGTGGPTNGRAVDMNVIVAGDNVVEVDATGVRLMGGEPRDVQHLRLASEQGLGSLEGFELLGEPLESVAARRDLPGRPGLNKLIISGVLLKVWNAIGDPLMRVTGGERVQRTAALGELVIDEELCNGCRLCLKACPVDALSYDGALECDRSTCIRCFCCAEVCPEGALSKRF